MIILDSLFPVFLLVVLGVALKRIGFTDAAFLRQSDRLVYYIFFPIMLFWKIGGASFTAGIDWRFCLASLLVIVTMFALSTLVIVAGRIRPFQAGSFSQSCYRFNTYIGVAVILNSIGERGVALFGILISLAIPLINLFAVSTLIWFSGQDLDGRERLRMLVRALAANPLILGCLAGILYSRLVGGFPVFVGNGLRLLSMVTLPLALLSIGGSLSFAGVRRHLPLSLVASVCKLAAMPTLGLLVYRFLGVQGVPFKVGMIFFALPASTAIYVLSSQLGSDTELASSAIVLSTLLSFVSLSVVLLL